MYVCNYDHFSYKVSFGVLDGAFYHSIPAEIRAVHRKLDPYAITNSYGLFRRLFMYICTLAAHEEISLEVSMHGQQVMASVLYNLGVGARLRSSGICVP